MDASEAALVARATIEQLIATGAQRGWAGVMPPEVSPRPADLPAEVQQALEHYDSLPSWLDVFLVLGRVDSPAGLLYLLRVGFEPTDGWVEVFGPRGEPWGAAQYIGATVGWAPAEEVRASLQTGQRVGSLATGLSWSEQTDGSYQSSVGQFRITPNASRSEWALSQNGKLIQAWDSLENAQGHARALAMPAE